MPFELNSNPKVFNMEKVSWSDMPNVFIPLQSDPQGEQIHILCMKYPIRHFEFQVSDIIFEFSDLQLWDRNFCGHEAI